METVQITVKIDKDVHERALEHAKKEKRSLSSQVSLWVEGAVNDIETKEDSAQ